MTDPTIQRSILPIPPRAHQGVTTYDAKDPATKFPPIVPLRPPDGAPNVVVILIDDAGFGSSSAFGGPCQTPNMEKLANEGLRYNRFHTTALCSPTRQALLTGRNHHSVGMGGITEIATSAPGYSSVLPKDKAPIAEILKLNGYSTAQFGKCHEVPVWQTSPLGPFDQWPTGGGGFEYFYGFLGGETNQWDPALYDGTAPIEPPKTAEEGYHFTEDMTDKTIAWVSQQKALMPDKPFFVYYAPGATHAPHHVPKEWADKYKGQFDAGWDAQREATIARQKELGVIPAGCGADRAAGGDSRLGRHAGRDAADLRPRRWRSMPASWSTPTTTSAASWTRWTISAFSTIPWSSSSSATTAPRPKARRTAASTSLPCSMAWADLETPEFLMEHIDEFGSPKSYNHYAVGWAHAMDTPYQWTKQVASHWGGTRNGMIVHWPRASTARARFATSSIM